MAIKWIECGLYLNTDTYLGIYSKHGAHDYVHFSEKQVEFILKNNIVDKKDIYELFVEHNKCTYLEKQEFKKIREEKEKNWYEIALANVRENPDFIAADKRWRFLQEEINSKLEDFSKKNTFVGRELLKHRTLIKFKDDEKIYLIGDINIPGFDFVATDDSGEPNYSDNIKDFCAPTKLIVEKYAYLNIEEVENGN